MNQASLAWAALRNMLREARRDPVWAITALCLAPFRAMKQIAQGFLLLAIVFIGVDFAGAGLAHLLVLQDSAAANVALTLVLLLILFVLLFRLTTTPDYPFRHEQGGRGSPEPVPASWSAAIRNPQSCCAMTARPIC